MKLGLRIPQRDKVNLRLDVTEVAQTAENSGFDSLWVYERSLYPLTPEEPYPYSDPPGGDWPSYYRQTADPLSVLAAAAMVTSHVRLGTSVLIAAQHIPFQLAKTIATIDQISEGRFVAGFGAGWSKDEMRAAGVDPNLRGRYLDETLDVLAAAWGPDPVSYQGRRTIVSNAIVGPKPASRVPVLIGGGGTPRTIERIASRADGWLSIPFGSKGFQEIESTWNKIRERAVELGRSAEHLEHIVCANMTLTSELAGAERTPFVGTIDQIVEDVVAASEVGVDELIIDLNLQDPWFTDSRKMLDTALEIFHRVNKTLKHTVADISLSGSSEPR
ncbi:LLM class F420-dependent oxidoreductase [Rhodococcus opacus]|uniref:LLM class F420-dependent oxidoreductase n=2 Tax=Rhodococcus opacus TaxID=37919 RepID=A0AAX3Y502_RHOOP|nr:MULTISPECIES: LLM class F420-dependent oxidoreductase [Rhodococcus]MBA8963546.1 putative F420-dependent oxidoreductase [Rhodococcus opacus]MBP2207036.1 putative F420-dependent oxidoreductase [Rhodococcus opacus]MCZ4586984.1 LLM class F420-dependent oxidoreductase [Rhodococcus opacus]MDI9940051.1 LLM class F420-dependent oxidoreductase [Rhodococcus sp. IEGM 1351]MDJ0419038.1 LLM class F420-dependent oxidoreductase [Rhodococcus opacus]